MSATYREAGASPALFSLNVAVEMTRKILSAAKNAKHAKNQKFFTFSDVDSR